MNAGVTQHQPHSDHTAIVVCPQRVEGERIARCLRRYFARVVQVRDPFEAVARAMDERVHLLVVSLEKMTSSDRKFLEPIRRYCLDVRTLLLVPEGKRLVARAFLQAGADGMLSAPHDDGELRSLVKSMIRRDGPDVLTGLFNRAAGEQAIPREIASAQRGARSLGYALLDLDKFKTINERWGYRAGDAVIASTAELLKKLFRRADMVIRLGGDEFQVLMTGLPSDTEQARTAACEKLQMVRRMVADHLVVLPAPHSDRTVRVTLSGGLSICAGETNDPVSLFELANQRLTEAKKRGGNQIVCGDKPCPHGDEGPAAPAKL